MKSVAGAQISPDGRYVAYTVQQANWDENDFYTQIWIAMPATGERYQLTSGKKSSSGAQWSPDSRRLAFTSDRDGKRQIYLISPAGGEAAQLTAEENGVGAIAWSPDGSAIAFTSSGPDAKARKDRKEKYGDFEIVGGDYTMNHLWLVKLPAELPADPKKLPKPEALTKGDEFSVGAFSWSPDGKRIAFSATPRSRPRLRRYRDALRARPGRPACQEAARIRRPQRQPQVVARRQRDRLHHLQRRAVLLLRQPLPGRDSRRGRPAAPAHQGVRRRPEPARLGTGRHLFRRHAEDRRPPLPHRSRHPRHPPHQRARCLPRHRRVLHQGSPHPGRHRRRAQSLPRNLRLLRLRFRAADTSPTSPRSTRISASPRAKWCSGNPRTARPSKAS